MKYKILTLFFVFTFLFGTTATYACSTDNPETTVMIENAEVIVRVEAEKYVEASKDDIRVLNEPSDGPINFKVKEILKGDSVPKNIILNGYLSDTDDFNEREVPYNFVRPGGRGGSCSAYEYKKDAEFLLFLKKVDEKYTVSWYPLAPTNEQLHSSNDEWITWVRKYLKVLGNKETFYGQYQNNEITEISFERKGCHGFCPNDKVTFRPSGLHSYEGIKYVKPIGSFQTDPQKITFGVLVKVLKRVDYANLQDYYGISNDNQVIILTVKHGNKIKTITSDTPRNNPIELVIIQTFIESVVSKINWKKIE
ncbi:MAG: DUF6438 domain-containing protein [Acidobacteriota bacterium]|jgi:hypothetical protein|nr:DUF6438 domain-containing protein [Acidobacteriota bacterium]